MDLLLFKQLGNLWNRLPVRHRGAVVVAIPAVCLLITLGSWIWSRESTLAVRRKIESTEDIIRESNKLLVELINAETSVRGYAFTRNPSFLEPYNQSLANYPTALARLQQMLENDPNLSTQLTSIQTLVQRNMAVSKQIITATNVRQADDARSPALSRLFYEGKSTMDSLRVAMNAVQIREQRLKDSFLRQREGIQEATSIALWLTGTISFLGFWAAIYLFTQLDRNLRDREQLLRESKSLLQAIVTSVVDGVITLDERGKIEIFNPTACEMFGYQPLEVSGGDLNLLLADPAFPHQPPPQKPDFIQTHLQQLGQAWRTLGIRKDGTTFPIAISISDVPLGDRRLIAIIRDMTEVEQTQHKLQTRADELARLTGMVVQTNNALEDRNRELEQFAYVASHDLKAPLRAIANLSEWIEEDLQGQLPEENQRQMQLLRGRVHRMEALINGLLEYSRVGRTETTITTVSVTNLLAEIIDSLAPPPSFTIEIAPDLPTFTTKMLLLRQVFSNLLSNAIKHHEQRSGHIKISVQDLGDAYKFAIADDGPGIAAEYHQKIFVIFQTLKARDTKENTGIGLSIVKKIVETEGGAIQVESKLGSGTTFYFTWLKQLSPG